jgi:uncharacterized protein (TIGR02118 family)
MIKVSVLYEASPGHKFDMGYYCDKHIPMVQQRLGSACKRVAVEQGIAGMAPGTPAGFITIAHVYCESVEAFQAAFAPHAQAIMADIANYTDIEPTIQISEVKI